MEIEPLTRDEIRVVNRVEQFWHLNRKFPPNDFFKDINVLTKPSFKRAMAMRGIAMSDDAIELTPEQLAAILAVTNYLDKRSQGVKLKALGINSQQWQGWLKNPVFKNYLHTVSSSTFDDAIHTVQEGLVKKAEAGDVGAVKFYMELTGRYTEDSGQLENLKVLVARLVEVIQRRVKDPELLRAISQDFNIVLTGGVPITHEQAQIEKVL